MKKIVPILCLIFFVNTSKIFARKDIYSSPKITGAAWLNNGSVSTSVLNGITAGNGGNLNYKNISLKSYVKFFLNTEAIPSQMGAFNAKVSVKIKYSLDDNNPSVVQSDIKILEINYDPAIGVNYKNVDIALYNNAHNIQVDYFNLQLSSGTNSIVVTNAHRDFIGLQVFTEHDRIHNFMKIFSSVPDNSPFDINITHNFNVANNELTLNWSNALIAENYYYTNEGYELEYTFIDDYSNNQNQVIPTSQINFSFKNNSTRILLKGNSYTMPMVQEHGYFVYRIRAYGLFGPDLDRIFFVSTSLHDLASLNGSDEMYNLGTFPNKFFTNGLVHTNDKINWQSVTTFAEEGKSKTVVKYMDGSLRTRQTVTSTSTEREAIIAETIYDFQGRAAVNTLPTPVDLPAIKYYPDFNLNNGGTPYNYLNFDNKNTGSCDYNIEPLSTRNGAGLYYSKNNLNKTLFNAFIPEANGYPFTRATFMPDPTERVVGQGNVGETFQPGNTGPGGSTDYQRHDTRYFYAAAEQTKLDQLFGTNVGYSSFYQKNLVIDPNGQGSVNYVNSSGKTVATALVGDAPKSLDPLKSNIAPTSMYLDLLETNNIVDNQNHSITSSRAFLVVSDNTKYDFNYTIQRNSFIDLACSNSNYCLDCIYDLEITLVNDKCGDVVYTNKTTIGNLTTLDLACKKEPNHPAINFQANLNVGSHTITKKLTVNKQAAETYIIKYLADEENNCIKTFDDFYKEAWADRDQTRCLDACEDCNTDAKNNTTRAQINAALAACDSLWCKPQIGNMCDISKQMMIQDLTPGGQYAIYKDGSGNFSPGISPISIFGVPTFNNNVIIVKTIASEQNMQNIVVDILSYGPKPLSFFFNSNNNYSLLQTLIANWPDDLSEKLLPLHPEYCYLNFCNLPQIDQSNQFDTDYMNANTLAEALVISNRINRFHDDDHFFAYLANTPYQNDFKNEFNNYTGPNSGVSLVKFAVFLSNCPSSNNIAGCTGQWGDNINDDDEWNKFKVLYYSLKQKYFQMAREYYVKNNGSCCPNEYIGCTADNCFVPTRLFGLNTQTNACKTNQMLDFYRNAKRRITNINDIPLPGTDGLSTSIYDLSSEEIATLATKELNESPLCLSCTELDAFKATLFSIQDKRYIKNGSSFNADAIAGLKDAIRERLTGTITNTTIKITNVSNTGFTMNTDKCKIEFKSDTTINWAEAEIFPTCLEMSDYKNAKLHIMVNESYKTTLTIKSDCELFYCEGEAPAASEPTAACKCDAKYDAYKIYQLGDIVQYENICYIVKKVDSPKGLGIKNSPESDKFWEKLCEQIDICENPFELDFETPGGFVSPLSNLQLTGNFANSFYVIRNQLSQQLGQANGVQPFAQVLPSNAFIVKINAPQLILSKQTTIKPNKDYVIKFDYGVWNMPMDGSVIFSLKVNGQTIYTNNSPQLRSVESVIINWNSRNITLANLEFTVSNFTVSMASQRYLSLDNIKMICKENYAEPVACNDVFNFDFESPAVFTSSLGFTSVSPTTLNRYTIQQNYPTNNLVFPSKAIIFRPNTNNQLLFEKIAPVVPSTQYKISFDARIAIDRPMQVEVKINNQSINIYTLNYPTQHTFTFNWNSTINNQVKLSIHVVQVKPNVVDRLDDIVLDNIKMECLNNGIANTLTSASNTTTSNNTTTTSNNTNSTSTSKTRYIPKNTCGCNALCDIPLPMPNIINTPCDSILKHIATERAAIAFVAYKDSLYKSLLTGYYNKCMQALETFAARYTDKEYHYTLYYYDQSGNLVRTVPPAGVKPLTNPTDLASVKANRNNNNGVLVPNHILLTTYQQNSLNAVVKQNTPDAGNSWFFYDKLGRIALSQNAKQAAYPSQVPTMNNKGSYTYYDRLGRSIEVGEVFIGQIIIPSLKGIVSNYIGWENFLSNRAKTEITKTFYDSPYLGTTGKINVAFGTNGQQNLRNRIATVALFANNANAIANKYDHATHYSYDIAGNVTDLLQDFGENSDFGSNPNNVLTQSRKMTYKFDLISGKVNELHYQKGDFDLDQYLYKYNYNADNKLTEVYTSTNGIIWENDAHYEYYRHGPLARIVYGTDKVQGIDMAYTLQGWIKGANGYSEKGDTDIGHDGYGYNPGNIGYTTQNKNMPADAFSYWLGYHESDYQSIGNNSANVASITDPLTTGLYHASASNLYNGNIRSMHTKILPFGGLGMHYKYDQLNRIKMQNAFDFRANGFMPNNEYGMNLEYDPNGNIQILNRNDRTPAMDQLYYNYYNSDNTIYSGDPTSPLATNKLAYVKDAAGITAEPSDIESQATNNYTYDAIGNLIKDTQEGLSITWNIQNKITKITKANGQIINYSYDGLGNRIKKEVIGGTTPKTEYYVRDAQGNTIAVYEIKTRAGLVKTEQHIYGSSRLGIYKPLIGRFLTATIPTAAYPRNGIIFNWYSHRNSTQYELSNHLGNVLATITDSRTNSNTATLITATDYYAFGMAMPGRKFALNNNKARYGFNGKENDEETGTQDYGFRIYNPALGKFLSVDPLTSKYPWYTPYQFAGNKVIEAIDLDGLEEKTKTEVASTNQKSDKNKNEADGMVKEDNTKYFPAQKDTKLNFSKQDNSKVELSAVSKLKLKVNPSVMAKKTREEKFKSDVKEMQKEAMKVKPRFTTPEIDAKIIAKENKENDQKMILVIQENFKVGENTAWFLWHFRAGNQNGEGAGLLTQAVNHAETFGGFANKALNSSPTKAYENYFYFINGRVGNASPALWIDHATDIGN